MKIPAVPATGCGALQGPFRPAARREGHPPSLPILRSAVLLTTLALSPAFGREYHVAVTGSDGADGSASKPLRTISAAAQLAQPGDTITVHGGTYRERITPPRGGDSDEKRIVYQAAPGESVTIKGSEVVRDWKPFAPGVWKATIPNTFFGTYNPYKDLIAGDWFDGKGRPHHTGEVYLNGKALFETHLIERVLNPKPYAAARDIEASTWTWFCESDTEFTYIYANFHNRNPNQDLVEINVRDAIFYPDKPGRNYVTVRGFRMAHAATQWAAPTAEQIGLIGTHWSKGWIIENNVISDSKCSGITLGKDRATGHNVWNADPRKDGATHYNETILRALKRGWSRENIGSHLVRNNTIFDCEQTGIAGSLGAVFSEITNNHIYAIWAKRQFTGAEMAGIKLHGAIDVAIRQNHIHNAGRGLWMDWMAQGTRITGNVLYDNTTDDLFVEVNHGPFLVDNNLFLSPTSLSDWSEGGAYAHNLFGGKIVSRPEPRRSTPFHRAHSTALAGLASTTGGDNRFYNNLFAGGEEAKPGPWSGFGLWMYDGREFPSFARGNVYAGGARPYYAETDAAKAFEVHLRPALTQEDGGLLLRLNFDAAIPEARTVPVTTELLGRTRVAGLPFENTDGSPILIEVDCRGAKRSTTKPVAGPFENLEKGEIRLKIR